MFVPPPLPRSRRDRLTQLQRDHETKKQVLRHLQKALPTAVFHYDPAILGATGAWPAKVTAWQMPDICVLAYAHLGPMFFTIASPASPQSTSRAAIFRHLKDLGYRAAIVNSLQDVSDKLSEWAVWDYNFTRQIEVR